MPRGTNHAVETVTGGEGRHNDADFQSHPPSAAPMPDVDNWTTPHWLSRGLDVFGHYVGDSLDGSSSICVKYALGIPHSRGPTGKNVVQLSDTAVVPPQFINLASQFSQLTFIAHQARHTIELRIQRVESAQVRGARCEALGDVRQECFIEILVERLLMSKSSEPDKRTDILTLAERCRS